MIYFRIKLNLFIVAIEGNTGRRISKAEMEVTLHSPVVSYYPVTKHMIYHIDSLYIYIKTILFAGEKMLLYKFDTRMRNINTKCDYYQTILLCFSFKLLLYFKLCSSRPKFLREEMHIHSLPTGVVYLSSVFGC